MKKIGVTGAAGFVGSHLCERLLAEDYEVVGVDDMSYGSMANLQPFLHHSGFKFDVLDCTQRRPLRAAFNGCDAIMHLAAKKIPRYGGTLSTLEVNVTGVNAACSVALALDADVIVTSTSDVYGDGTPPYREDGQLVIGPPTSKRWAYAVSKMYDEHHALALADERDLKVTILRLFNVYGPRNHRSWWGGPITAFTETLLDGGIMELHGDGRQVRSFTYVTDTVDGFVRALDTPAGYGEILNVGGDEPITIVRLATAVQEALGISGPLRAKLLPYERIGGRYQDVRCRIPDTEKAARILGFNASVGLDEGLRASVAWHLEMRERDAGSRKAAIGAA
jgi:UDP-glucose 4-epimerase